VSIKQWAYIALAGACASVAPGGAFSQGTELPREMISPAFAETIANVPGTMITAIVVDYPPGGKSLSHRHGNAFVVGYVLQGAIRSKINERPEKIFRAGERWTEAPGVHHIVSQNVSKTEPAKLLAIFVADTKDKNPVIWDKK
jgi:quercetin dioxygenase-like cupin family protein